MDRRRHLKIFLLLAGIASLGSLVVGIIYASAAALFALLVLSLVLGCIALALFIVCLILNKKLNKDEEDSRLAFQKEVEEAIAGERNIFKEDDPLCRDLAKVLNERSLFKTRKGEPYGVYPVTKYDEIVLASLEDNGSVKGGVAIFVFDVDSNLVRQGPRDALLLMAKAHFGENVYYGLTPTGVAIFSPVLSSKEEFLGKARRTVQLYSYSDEDLHIGVKAGIAYYPDFAPKYLTYASLAKTMEDELLLTISKDTDLPHFGYDASEKDAFLQGYLRFEEFLGFTKSFDKAHEALINFLTLAAPYVGADSLGILIYVPSKGTYQVAGEYHQGEAVGFDELGNEGYVDAKLVTPFVEWSHREKGVASAGQGVFLPTELSSILDSLHASSISVLGVFDQGEPLGLIYASANCKDRFENDPNLSLTLRCLREYVRFYTAHRLMADTSMRDTTILSSFEHFAYALDKGSFTLSYVSPNLASVVKEAKVGAVCHKALFGLDSPCKNCPLFHDNVEMMVPRVSSGVFAYRAIPLENETMMILSPHQSDFSSSRIDALTGCLADQALHEDLQNEILLKESSGVILAFRLRNIDTIKRMFRLSSNDEPIKLAASILQSATLGRGLYRNGEAGFAYLLPYVDKEQAFVMAGKITKALSGKFPFLDKSTEFVLDFVTLSYPLEAETPFALDALLRVLYQKADASMRGRLFQVDNEQGRLVDEMFYAKTKLEEGIRLKKMPIRYEVYEELIGKKPALLEAHIALENEVGALFDEKEILGVAEELGKLDVAEASALSSILNFLGAKKKQLRTSSLQGAILRLDPSCFSREFAESIINGLGNTGASPRNLFLEVREEDTLLPEFKSFAEQVKKAKVRFGLSSYDGKMEKEELKNFAYVAFHASSVRGKDKNRFLLSLSNVRELGLNVLIKGYQSEEERHYLASLAFHYGKKKGASWLKESEAEALL